jgi:hypothetical protein
LRNHVLVVHANGAGAKRLGGVIRVIVNGGE